MVMAIPLKSSIGPNSDKHGFLFAYLPFFHSAKLPTSGFNSLLFWHFCVPLQKLQRQNRSCVCACACARAMQKPLEACVVELAAPESCCLHPNGNGANDQELLLNCERLLVCLCVYWSVRIVAMAWQLQIPSSVRWKFTRFDSISHRMTHIIYLRAAFEHISNELQCLLDCNSLEM